MPYLSKPKLLFTFLLALVASYALSQQPNPFRSIGKKADVIDISQGRYVEIIEKDSVERIGSVLINRYTRKIERLLDEAPIDTGTDNTVQSRFFSVDPLARQFPELSPYQFAGNTPIQAVDLDGMEPQGFMEYWKVKTEYHTKWNFTVQDVYDYKTKQTWTVMHYPNTNEYYYWQTKYEGANRLFVPQNTSLNRQENQWTGLFKQFTPTHLSEDRSFHYAMVGMLASPFVAMGAIEGTAAALPAVEAYALRTIGNALLRYWYYAPAIGHYGTKMAEFLDESGSVGGSNASRFAKLKLEEQLIVKTLVESGRNVEIVPRAAHKTADFLVDGVTTELKSLTAETFNMNSAVTVIQDAFKQGKNVILDAMKYDLDNSQVKQIIDRVTGSMPDKKLPGNVEIWTQSGQHKF